MEYLRYLFARLVADGNPRLGAVALGGLGVLVASSLAGVLFGHGAWLLLAGAGSTASLWALIVLESQRRARDAGPARTRRSAEVLDRSGRAAPAPAPAPASAPASAPAPAEPPNQGAGPVPVTEPAALPANRTYPDSLRALLSADAPLPQGHVWPDTARIRGSLALRAEMAGRVAPPRIAVPASGSGAPRYVDFVDRRDMAIALHSAALGFRATVVVALLDASVHPRLSPTERHALDDAVAKLWASSYAGVLTPPPVLDVLARLAADRDGPGGAYLLELLEQVRATLRGGRGLDAALARWAASRAMLADAAVRQHWTPEQRGLAEVMCDWLLLQRAAAEDVTAAERDRSPGETRGDALQRVDEEGPFAFERALSELLDPHAVARHAPAEARAAAEVLGPTEHSRAA